MLIEHIRALLASSMLLASPTALACTCCGLDDMWRSEAIAPGSHEASVVDQLKLGPGWFRPQVCPGCSDLEEWSISAVERTEDGFVFTTDIGTFRFRSNGQPEYRAVDVTFMTAPKRQPLHGGVDVSAMAGQQLEGFFDAAWRGFHD